MRAERPPQAPPRLLLPLHSWGRGGPGGGGGGDAKQMASQAGPRLRGGAHSREWYLRHLDPISETARSACSPLSTLTLQNPG